MSSATALAHPNIALVKYWGKRDLALNLPAVSSVSLTLDGFATRTTVTWDAPVDDVRLNDAPADTRTAAKVRAFLDLLAPGRPPCSVTSHNDFPTGAGLASSASAFAALALAGAAAAGQDLDLVRLSVLARQGSGSACRSLWGGFVTWHKGTRADGLDSHGVPLAPQDHWDLSMVVAVVSTAKKEVGSTAGMERSRLTSPFYGAWLDGSEAKVREAEHAVRARDLERLGHVMERSTLEMHATMSTSDPPLLYWQGPTVACLHEVWGLRRQGVAAWATMDAGPQVKVLCDAKDAATVARALRPHVHQVHVLAPGGPARLCAP